MFWGQTLIEFRRTNKARSWPNFRAWHLKTDSRSAFATSLVGSRSPPLTTSFGISAFDMSRGTHPPTLPMSSRTHHFPNRRPPDARGVSLHYRRETFQDPAFPAEGRPDLAYAATCLLFLRNANRSALIVAASVVGMPWGKPL